MASGLPTAFRHIKDNQKPLRFNSNGKFRILHLTDIHEVDPAMDDDENPEIPKRKSEETINVIRKCVELAKPDLVVFGGDNISGFWEEFTYEYMRSTIKKIIAPIAEKNIPLAIVFGNHDAESAYVNPFMQRENQICVYSEYDNFRSSMNDEDVFGCANCSLPVLHSNSDKIAWNIWCVDSNDYIRQSDYSRPVDLGYDYVHEDQIAWRERTALKLREQNGGKNVPSILFQHIPVLQEYDRFEEVSKETDGAFEKNGRYYKVPDGVFSSGSLNEAPCPTNERRDEFESWVRTGDIAAAFFGHDHVNDFTENVEGIDLVQTIGAGYHTYGGERGGRLIILDENVPYKYETEIYCIDKISKGKV